MIRKKGVNGCNMSWGISGNCVTLLDGEGGVGSGELCYNDCFGSFGWREQKKKFQNVRLDEFI